MKVKVLIIGLLSLFLVFAMASCDNGTVPKEGLTALQFDEELLNNDGKLEYVDLKKEADDLLADVSTERAKHPPSDADKIVTAEQLAAMGSLLQGMLVALDLSKDKDGNLTLPSTELELAASIASGGVYGVLAIMQQLEAWEEALKAL